MKKNFLRIMACMLVAVMALSAVPLGGLAGIELGLTASAAKAGVLEYKIENKEAIVTGCNQSVKGSLSIPSKLGGYPVTSIGNNVFEGFTDLKSITIPNSVTSIGGSAFWGCTNLKSITIPGSVTSVGGSAFYQTAWYDAQPDGEIYIGKVFYNYKGTMPKNTKIVIKNGTKSISDFAFGSCTGLTSITIPNSVTSIGGYAFSGCSGLKSVTIPNSVKSIGNYVFNFCTGLKSISIPDSVESIGYGAFYQTAWYNAKHDGEVYAGKVFYNYKGTMPKNTKIVIKNGTKGIAGVAFQYCKDLKSITIPNSVTSIGDFAFDGCTGLTDITIPNSVKSIGRCVFQYCTGLKSVTIPNGVTSIGDFAFDGCTGLTDITIPNSIKSIGEYAFYGCTGLKSVTITKSVKSIGDNAFGYRYNNKTGNLLKITGFTISGYKGTAAEKYAKENGFKFVALSESKPVNIGSCTVTTAKSITYTGKALTPKITVKNGKTTLKVGTHYTVSYKNNTKIGKATVTIKGVEKNGYTGTKTLTFNILPGVTKSLKAIQSTSSIKLTWSKVAGATGYRVYRHDGKKWVKLADTKNTTYTVSKLKAGTNYKYAVKAYTAVGKAVYWSASYAQLSTATKPATPAIKVTAGKKQVTVSWNKVTGATGYVVYYSTSKNGTYNKLATVKGTSYTARKLATGKTYYFKVAAYKTVGKTNIYSSYSSVKSVKVK